MAPFPYDEPPSVYDDSPRCRTDATATVWVDQEGRGVLVAFNLGDGDLTRQEVAWAVRTVRDNRAALGINSKLPDGALIGGSFSNRQYDCFEYTHPDHYAVHQALHDVDFGMDYQAAPTCADDPETARSEVVTDDSAAAAFEVGPHGKRMGSHTRNYGWLYNPYYPLDREGQNELFHTHQEFWVRWRH